MVCVGGYLGMGYVMKLDDIVVFENIRIYTYICVDCCVTKLEWSWVYIFKKALTCFSAWTVWVNVMWENCVWLCGSLFYVSVFELMSVLGSVLNSCKCMWVYGVRGIDPGSASAGGVNLYKNISICACVYVRVCMCVCVSTFKYEYHCIFPMSSDQGLYYITCLPFVPPTPVSLPED